MFVFLEECCIKQSVCLYSNYDLDLKRKFYEGAFTSYQRALGILDTRKHNPELWDLVTWELSTGTFTLAQHLIDNTSAAQMVSN